jgi:hypothetical protein
MRKVADTTEMAVMTGMEVMKNGIREDKREAV